MLPLLNKREGDKIVPLPTEEQISTNLAMTAEQKSYMADVESYVRGNTSLTNICVNSNGYEDEESDGEAVNKGEALDLSLIHI